MKTTLSSAILLCLFIRLPSRVLVAAFHSCRSWEFSSIERTRSFASSTTTTTAATTTTTTIRKAGPSQRGRFRVGQCSVATTDENKGDQSSSVEDYGYDDDDEARSQFGTKEYWDEMYQGRGDFPMDEYQWYFGFERYGKLVQSHAPSKDEEILIPGIGNDPILLDLLQKGYTKLTATDYSQYAIERQEDFLSHEQYPYTSDLDGRVDDDGNTGNNNEEQRATMLLQMDARKMPLKWADKFDAIVEKGALDAIYLSGDGNVELTAKEFERTLKPGGILISVSGVVPAELRKEVFKEWTWIRDGSDDLEAGCFVLEKPKL
eukprot:CAMPEP_0201261490 /NCGR_PEP_ID=MMETSP0853-20130426/5630_1 /ASSEMBLY_ACC=CAM_ASM_000640 /TAXON_ID=183588 /ORGANISM="Pseudo-nitzschia fraudulenta, Strain WWA7" /LENGTH=318 /DNA_ID=CAMNT_0047564455 /DNA_START=42 /DNA_END=998 /DNA_ORIENTATION=+